VNRIRNSDSKKSLLPLILNFLSDKLNRRKRKKSLFTKDRLKDQKHVVEVGDHTYGHPKVFYWQENATLKIGKFCSIAEDVVIFLGGNHRVDWVTTYGFPVFLDEWPEGAGIENGPGFVKGRPYTKGDVIIENDVWIGYGVTIMSGVKIGNGAVVGARAVVTRDVEPYTIVAGNPARVIRKRFSEEVIGKLLKLSWWNWPEEKIRKHVKLLCSTDYEKLFMQGDV